MGRNASVDYMRLVAAFGIVVFHAQAPGAQIGYAALPFFLMLLIALSTASATKSEFLPYARGRVSRLMWPWVTWSIFYGLLKLAEAALTSATLGDEFDWHMLVTGPALHLWFLPYACLACLLIWPMMRAVPEGSANGRLMLAAGTAAVALAALGCDTMMDPAIPFSQWLYAAPALALGLGFAVTPDGPVPKAVLLGAVCLVAWGLGWTEGMMQVLLAGGLFIAVTTIWLPQTALSAFCARSAMTVYLAHPFVIAVAERIGLAERGTLGLAVIGCLGGLAVAVALPPVSRTLRTALAGRTHAPNTKPNTKA